MITINKSIINQIRASRAERFTLNFFQVYVYSIYYYIKYSCSFLIAKKNHATCGQKPKATSFCQKEARLKPAFSETISLVFKDLIAKTFLQYLESLLNFYITNFYQQKAFIYLNVFTEYI